ncbi:MAG: TRAP transporter small permease subunit [Spirochaetales bacterium]
MRKVSGFFQNVAVVFLITLFFSVAAQIVLRNVFDAGSSILEELARFSLVSLVFLMIPVLTIEKKQIIVDIVLLYLPASVRRIFDLFIQILSAGFSVFILLAIAKIMERNWNVQTPAIRMPNAVFYFPVAVGILFTLIGSLYHFVKILNPPKEAGK